MERPPPPPRPDPMGDGKPQLDPGDDRALIQRMLALTPEQRLQGLAQAAAFFRSARRV